MKTIYPSSFNLHNDALAMVANLWNAPQDARQDGGPYPGAQTVGSTEACLLAGLALKFRWRKWRAARDTGRAPQAATEPQPGSRPRARALPAKTEPGPSDVVVERER